MASIRPKPNNSKKGLFDKAHFPEDFKKKAWNWTYIMEVVAKNVAWCIPFVSGDSSGEFWSHINTR